MPPPGSLRGSAPEPMSVAPHPLARHGTVRWLCDPPHGVGRLLVDSDPIEGETTPGELLAVAYSAFIVTDLAERLELNGVPADELVVQAWCRLSAKRASVDEFDLKVMGRVPGIDQERFRFVAGVALASCHASIGMRRDLRTKLHVTLER
jgi:organic hydroperoxide reductase OsmC/OhrA